MPLRDFVKSLKLKSRGEREEYCKSGRKTKDIPYQGRQTYKKDWKGWGDWLGTDYVANQLREYRTFEEARNFARSLGLHNQHEWKKYATGNMKPADIPANPQGVYNKEWINWFSRFGKHKSQ